MMGRTHILLGLNALWLLETQPLSSVLSGEPSRFPLCVGAVVMGALFPDLDAGQSLLSNLSIGGVRPFFLPARVLHSALGHRGALHSLFALGIVGVSTLPVACLDASAWICLLLGYGSHLVGDACTKRGIPLFYVPFFSATRVPVHLLPKSLRLTTGSLTEEAVFALFSVPALTLLLRHLAFVPLS